MEKQEVTFEEFLEIEKKLDIRVGNITSVEEVPKSDKLLKLTVNFGNEERIVVTNIKNRLTHWQYLNGTGSYFIMNLKPVKMMGIESTAMILPNEDLNGKLSFIQPNTLSIGSKLL